MDTAPTGHTLLLLDATGAYHREIARQMADKQLHFTTPMMQPQDPHQTKVLIVTLAETTPVLKPQGYSRICAVPALNLGRIINNSLSAANPQSSLLRQRALNERTHITAVATQHAHRYALVPLLEADPVGIVRLEQLTRPGA
jgi:arsenite-transporting ATPase